jgi:uncharacterized membrane protein YedE/YeeE
MANFTPVSAAIGGALIGLSAVLLMLSTGRVAGISGIFAGLLNFRGEDKGWGIAFLGGLILAPILAGLIGYGMAQPALPSNWIVIAVAGLLVGFGTRLSGGMARLSPRSVAATIVFMVMAIVTVAITRHVLGG